MFVIQDGRECFYQWDIDRKLIVKDSSIKEVHFCNKTEECSLVCATYQENGETLVNVPNILLQSDWKINVYGYTGDYTKHSACFKVVKRSKPADYAYTETEVLNYAKLEEQINELANQDYITREEFVSETAIFPTTDNVRNIVDEEVATAIENQDLITREELYEQGYVNCEEMVSEIDAALRCYPNYDYLHTNYYNKEEVEQLVEEGKAVIVSIIDNKSSMSSQEITEAVENGYAVYLEGFDGKYLVPQYIEPSKVTFEYPVATSIKALDGNSYAALNQRTVAIRDNTVAFGSTMLPSQDYIDAQVAYEKPYELIQSFTLTEDTKTVELSGFELDKFILYVTTPIYETDGGCRVQISKGEEFVFNQWVNYILAKTENISGFYGKNEGGLAFVEFTNGSYLTRKAGYFGGINPYTKINFTMSACIFPTGTKFELWGVKQ